MKHNAILKDGKLYWIQEMPVYFIEHKGKKYSSVNQGYKKQLQAAIDSAILFEDQKQAIHAVEFNKEISVVKGKPVVILQENKVYSFEWPWTVEKVDGEKVIDFEGSECYPIYEVVARLIAPKEDNRRWPAIRAEEKLRDWKDKVTTINGKSEFHFGWRKCLEWVEEEYNITPKEEPLTPPI